MMEAVVHNILLLFKLLLQLIISYGAEISITTPNKRDYTMLSNYGITATDRVLTFQVEACSNAYVGLMSGNKEFEPLYEIDFGGYDNSVSFIRAGKSNTLPRLVEFYGRVLHCSKYKEFRITWDDDTINVSHGLDDSGSTFLTWTRQTLWPIQNIGISTAFGANGEWIFHTQDNLQTTTLSYTEISTQISASSLGTSTPPTTTDGKESLSQSPKTNDVPSTSDSTTITEHQLSVSTDFPATSNVTSPTSLKTTETSDFPMTSKLTTTNSEINVSTNSPTISIFTTANPQTTTSKDLQSTSDGTTTRDNKPTSIALPTASNDTQTNPHTSTAKSLPTTSKDISTWSQISTSMEMKTIPDNTGSKIETYDSTSTYRNTIAVFEQSTTSANMVSPPTALSTSEATPCPAACTKTYTCHCPTASETPTSSDTLGQLKIDKKTLSSYKRRHQSASDPRKSSFYIGCVGITVLVLIVAFIVILDFLPRA